MATAEIKISELPEEVTEDGLKVYGPASYETQVAILSQYLHTLKGKHDIASGEKRDEILEAIRDFIEYKRQYVEYSSINYGKRPLDTRRDDTRS